MKNDAKLNGKDNHILNRMETYQRFSNEVVEIADEIRNANNQSAIDAALDTLATIMELASQNSQLADAYKMVDDVKNTISAVRLNYHTRGKLLDALNELIELCNQFIEQEKTQEKLQRIRRFFLQCAEHAEDILNIIGDGESVG